MCWFGRSVAVLDDHETLRAGVDLKRHVAAFDRAQAVAQKTPCDEWDDYDDCGSPDEPDLVDDGEDE